MKIIVLSSCYPNRANLNSGIFVHQQLKALTSTGVECHVIQPVNWFPPFGLHRLHPYWNAGHNQYRTLLNEVEGIPVYHPRVFVRMPSRFFKVHAWDLEGRAIAYFIKRNRELKDADLIYAQFLIHEGYVGSIVKELTGIPLVSIALGDDVHAWPEQNPKLIPFLKRTLYESDLLLANSKALAKDTDGWADAGRPVKTLTAYQGIDLVKFRPLKSVFEKNDFLMKFGLNPDNKHLLCVATPVKLKGWLELLDAVKMQGERFVGWKLVMVAPRRKEADALDLMMEAEKRGIGNFVLYLGAVNHDAIAELMRAVDAFVLASYNEGLSNAVIEAMASGLPVITTDVGGHKEFITTDENGILVPAGNTEALTSALRSILIPSVRQKLSNAARTGAESIGSYNSNAEKLLRLINKFAKKRPKVNGGRCFI